jgi:tetratricopeptide (TPR) repeat protein
MLSPRNRMGMRRDGLTNGCGRLAAGAGSLAGARHRHALALLACLFVAAPPLAGAALAAKDNDGMVAAPKPIDLDGLFEKLKNAPDAASAGFTSKAIEQRWSHSGSDTADLLMQRANASLAAGDRPLAIELLDRIVFLEPGWVEGWNRRATIFFLEDDYSRSAADIEEVLKLEPRHFGALMGLAGILERIGDERRALQAYERVLAIYPTLANAQKAADRLRNRLGNTDI